MVKKVKLILINIIILFIILSFSQIKYYSSSATEDNVITIGIPANPYIQDISTNYYKEWIENEMGVKLKFVLIPKDYTSEYLSQMFRSENITVDALFSFPCEDNTASVNSILQEYGEKGYIIPLNSYIKKSSLMKNIFSDFPLYDLKKAMTSTDGNIYYMPGLDTSIEEKYPQIMWINQSWLKALNLPIPNTLDEFKDTLQAFKNMDPNGNGQSDEIPLAGSTDILSEQSYNFLINSFIYNDTENCRMIVQDGIVYFAPFDPKWRQAVQYIHDLYKDNLLDSFQFNINHNQLVQLANDPRNLLGAFTSSSITDILLSRSPEIMSNYVRVPPLTGDYGTPYATIQTPLPKPNGVITSTCKDPDTVFHIFELMLSKQAFLIGRYGQEGVDWVYANSDDIDLFGNHAVILVKNQLRNKVQNKNIQELGPFFAYTEYTHGVAWNGIEFDQEYINAHAYKLYRQYRPKDYIKTIIFDGDKASELSEIKRNINLYTDINLQKFIKGELDPYDDLQWTEYINQYKSLEIDKLLTAIQNSYNSLQNSN
ncbi:type 2 periplasmic-binding domain-containing protein [Anaerovorax odorimutans]|uniref:hypothetical protein n=1 Tax=Anaerovorax odorimutans TaxID=109327 RepID=UPI000401EA6F|nr:hypothetical protein [Anaerovorax odorimutans]